MIDFYNVDIKSELITVVDLDGKTIVISQTDNGVEMELKNISVAEKYKKDRMNDEPYFQVWLKEHPEYLRGIVRCVFENDVEVVINE